MMDWMLKKNNFKKVKTGKALRLKARVQPRWVRAKTEANPFSAELKQLPWRVVLKFTA
jgi:hypothetical protein